MDLDQGIDTTDPGGRLLFRVLAAISEFDRDLAKTLGIAASTLSVRLAARKPSLVAAP